MAPLYTPHLTRWRVATSDGDELDCVDYKVRSLIFQCEDCHRLFPDYKEDTHECRQGVLTDGREDGTGVARQRLSWDVTKGEKKGVAEVDVVDYEVWVLGCVGHYLYPESNTVE
ncbi:hypothetical protein OsI_29200 [Oryza sativa Indica Group]|uniref:Uncharacterized protein n=1 Tax=Oryza sativa subsp. indica TaxID=39946 RepID=B8BAU2_ORYSI|nr:hypothetical protein OsI_29200 [Oryza sativa Indica Group]